MKIEDFDLHQYSQELIDFKDATSAILNYGKYSAPVLTARPNWKAREGEHCYAYIAHTDGSGGYDFYTYFWINSGWIYMQWLSAATNLYYQASTSVPVWDAVLNPIIALSDRSIESIKIALGAIGSDNMALDSIYTEALSVGAVTATRIGSNAIITGHLSANAVTATAISSTAITADKIAANAITSTKIAAEQILATHLTTGELVTLSAQIKDAIITNAKIGSLDVNKLTAGTMAAIDFVISTAGNIRSENYVENSAGFLLDGNAGLEVNDGDIKIDGLEIGLRTKIISTNFHARWPMVGANLGAGVSAALLTITDAFVKMPDLNTIDLNADAWQSPTGTFALKAGNVWGAWDALLIGTWAAIRRTLNVSTLVNGSSYNIEWWGKGNATLSSRMCVFGYY